MRRLKGALLKGVVYLAAALTCALLVGLIGYIFLKGLPGITWELLSTAPSALKGTIGILPNLLNTLYIVGFALLAALPLGVGAAVYLTEYAASRWWSLPPRRWPAFRRFYTAWWACCFSARCCS